MCETTVHRETTAHAIFFLLNASTLFFISKCESSFLSPVFLILLHLSVYIIYKSIACRAKAVIFKISSQSISLREKYWLSSCSCRRCLSFFLTETNHLPSIIKSTNERSQVNENIKGSVYWHILRFGHIFAWKLYFKLHC